MTLAQPVPVVLLAAGASRRLGSPKQLLDWGGATLLRRAAGTALAGGGPVLVVTGFRAADMEAELAGLPLQVVRNPHWEEGMGASLRCGVAALPPASGVLLMVCDQPAVSPDLLARMQEAHRLEPSAIVACAYGGSRGTPALFPARTFGELLAMGGDRGARALLQGPGVITIPFPEGAGDVDRPEDLRGAFPLFDAHLHIIDPRFPLVANQGFRPEPFTCADYLARMRGYGLAGGAVVSGSFQAFDQAYLVEALKTLGPGYVGVTQVPVTIPDAEILALHRAGVRAVRFNLKRGGSEAIRELDRLARRVYDLAGWHAELYAEAQDLEPIFATVAALPKVSVDHLGLTQAGFGTLLRLVERGVRVKATGFGRVDFEVGEALRKMDEVNPEALMFGTDLPGTRAPRAFAATDFELVQNTLGAERARKIFFNNAQKFYA